MSDRAVRRILVVDDEPEVRTLLRECFEMEGWAVSEAADGRALAAALASEPVDLVTLDLKLGGENGLDLARYVRATNNVPIVMITGRGDTIDRVVGLELGADDYITKPFHVREVLARVKAVLRRYDATAGSAASANALVPGADGAGKTEAYEFDRWVLDIDKRELSAADGRLQELTTAEFNMLGMFVRRPSRVLSRDNIMDLLKGHDWAPYDRSIDSLIVRVRRKIESDPEVPRLIKTVRGVGYVFAADVKRV
jgi:DNA-binding response OmpR family regulator